MAKDLNIPEDLVNKGSFDQWDVLECIKNLRIMSQVYEDEWLNSRYHDTRTYKVFEMDWSYSKQLL